jgi:hypothetical protein
VNFAHEYTYSQRNYCLSSYKNSSNLIHSMRLPNAHFKLWRQRHGFEGADIRAACVAVGDEAEDGFGGCASYAKELA